MTQSPRHADLPQETIEFLRSRAEKGTVNSLAADWWQHILRKVPAHLRTVVDPATEEDDVARKQLQAKKDFYDALESEVRHEYETTLKKQLSE